MGRRCADDARQIRRWLAIRRHIAQLQKNCPPGVLTCRPRQRQALLHWAYDSRLLWMNKMPTGKGGSMRTQCMFIVFAAILALCGTAWADVTVQMNLVDEKGIGATVGQVIISESPYGLVFTPALSGLPPELHGFHLHENPSCAAREKRRQAGAGDGRRRPL